MFEKSVQKLWSEQVLESKEKEWRIKSWNKFEELGLPTRKNEVWRYIKLRNLYTQEVVLAQVPTVSGKFEADIVFLNGRFQPELSKLPEEVVVKSLQEAGCAYGTFLKNQWSRSLKTETDPFAALNGALQTAGVFIYIPPKCQLDKPIHIHHEILTNSSAPLILPRVHIMAGADAKAQFLITSNSKEGEYIFNQVVEVTLDDHAVIDLVQDQTMQPQSAWHLEAIRATLKKNSHFRSHIISTGSRTSRQDYRIHLTGVEAAVDLVGLGFLRDKREFHTNIFIEHQEPNCQSNQLFKNVLMDQAHSSFEGKIYVHSEAQRTEAYQLNANLLLDEGVRAESKPNLEIFADDVKASHGATFGQLEEEHLFYLRTRGLSPERAKQFCIRGFCQEVYDAQPISQCKERFSDL